MAQRIEPPEGSLRELAEQKEREWREIQELRVETLDAAYKQKDKDLNEEKAKFQKLKEDFKYNLRLLEERDKELERYDAVFAELRAKENAKNAEISELKIKQDELRTAVSREEAARAELQKHYQHRLREQQQDLDKFRSLKEAEVKREREEFEKFKRDLERSLQEVEADLDAQKRELTTGFDEALRRREHEFRKQADEMSNTVLAHELKVKLLSKELEMVRSASEKQNTELQHTDQNIQQLQKALKQKEWELQDVTSIKNARIEELEKQMKQMEVKMQRLQEEFQRKHADVDRYAREKETALTAAKEAHAERERALEESLRDLQTQLETKDVELRRQAWNLQDVIKDKDMVLEKFQQEISDLKTRGEAQVTELSRNSVARDMELQVLREQTTSLKEELLTRKVDIDRYKKDLTLALERESSLERAKAQLELDWQRRGEDMERLQYQKSEELIHNLTQARDEAVAAVREKDRELEQREDLVRILTQDRDRALATLRRHGLQADTHIPTKEDSPEQTDPDLSASEQIQQLQQQNQSLKAVIHQMRQQMEQLGGEMAAPTANQIQGVVSHDEHGPITADYVKSLEAEVRVLKAKNRQLAGQVEDASSAARQLGTAAPGAGVEKPVSADNAYLRAHIKELNDTIGGLRVDKVSSQAQLKKQQARIPHLEGQLAQLQQEARQKQVENDQLQYDLAAQSKRAAAETAALRSRVTDLELQLAETRKEADEYYRGGLQRNLEATALGNQISSLKIDLASGKTASMGPEQSLLVKELQGEIQSLRQQLSGAAGHATAKQPMRSRGGSEVVELRRKLKGAAQHIGQLAKERQQLIELGNRLRAELARATGGGMPSSNGVTGAAADRQLPSERAAGVAGARSPDDRDRSRRLGEEYKNKLGELEKLQYQLTQQELRVAKQQLQREQRAAAWAVVESSVELESNGETAAPEQPAQPSAPVTGPAQYPPHGPTGVNHHYLAVLIPLLSLDLFLGRWGSMTYPPQYPPHGPTGVNHHYLAVLITLLSLDLFLNH
ncbi:coiled-coil domain-containing protein 57-like [Branchiostoma lanceolatum]|uniref:coiled-coil domain-containing protein 57-like n=1 Tax=Branchiostoma lanceolatum TaxID=7740 RepID=UPI0034519478